MPPSYAVSRVQKCDSRGPGGLLRHCLRTGPTQDHVDQAREIRVLLGPAKLNAALAAAHKAVPAKMPDGRKVRKDSVRWMQVLLYVSPEALGGPVAADWTPEAKEAFETAALAYLTSTSKTGCPGKVVHAVVHYDEASPHVHALVVPIATTERGTGLSCVQAFGGRTKQAARECLADMQTNWANTCQAFGLAVERGRERVKTGEPAPRYDDNIHVFKRRRAAEEAAKRQEQEAAQLQKQKAEEQRKAAALSAKRQREWTELDRRLFFAMNNRLAYTRRVPIVRPAWWRFHARKVWAADQAERARLKRLVGHAMSARKKYLANLGTAINAQAAAAEKAAQTAKRALEPPPRAAPPKAAPQRVATPPAASKEQEAESSGPGMGS